MKNCNYTQNLFLATMLGSLSFIGFAEADTKSAQPAPKADTTTIKKKDTSDSDTIYSALESAYQNNPELAAEITKVNQADEKMPQAKAGFRPNVQGTLQTGVTNSIYGGEQKNIGFSTTAEQQSVPNVQAGLTVTQNLYAGGATLAQVKGAENTIKAARARLLNLEQQIFLQVIQTIVDIILKESEIDLYYGNLKYLKQALSATEDKFKVGEETLTAVAQAKANLADGEASLENAKSELEALKATFKRLTGRAPKKLVKPDVVQYLPKTLEQAIQSASENNPAVIGAKFEEAVARYEVDRTGAGLLPSIDLKASSNFTASHDRTRSTVPLAAAGGGNIISGGNTRTDLSANVVMTVPIYEQGTVRSQKRAAHEAAAGARIGIETQRRVVIEKLIASWQNYLAAKANIQSFKEQVKASKTALDGTQQEMQVGTKILLDVLNAQKDLLRSELNLVRAERAFLYEAFNILSWMGGLTAKQMKLKNVKYYDPKPHYNDVKKKI